MKYFITVIILTTAATVGFLAFKKSSPGESINENVEVLSWSPRLFLFHHFLTHEECDYLIARAEPSLQRSTVVDYNSEQSKVDEARTSRGTFIHDNDPIIRNIERKIALITQMPLENGESLQILHYSLNAEYKPHFDYFDQETTGGSTHFNRGGQRVATILMYLNTPEEGGETIFPTADIKVKPVKGNAVLFYNCKPDGSTDDRSLHGGAPVLKGEKWLATKWLRQQQFK